MHCGTSLCFAALLAAAILFPHAARAGEALYTGPGATPGVQTNKPTAPDGSYFCLAGIGGGSHVLYLTAIRHEDWPYDSTGTIMIRKASAAWQQAMRGQPSALNAHCQDTPTAQIQSVRQGYVDQARRFGDRIVDMNWHYGQVGPATPVGGSTASTAPTMPTLPTQPSLGTVPSAPSAPSAPSIPTTGSAAAQSVSNQAKGQVNQQVNQLLNKLFP